MSTTDGILAILTGIISAHGFVVVKELRELNATMRAVADHLECMTARSELLNAQMRFAAARLGVLSDRGK